jgi:hypothetical protein
MSARRWAITYIVDYPQLKNKEKEKKRYKEKSKDYKKKYNVILMLVKSGSLVIKTSTKKGWQL